jgi:hemerythrin superfamily protein
MDSIEILKQDHRTVDQLFTDFLSTDVEDVDRREDLFQQMQTELTAHTEAEEKAFYPALRNEVPDKVERALREHAEITRLLTDLLEIDFEDQEFESKFSQMVEHVRNHIEEEEAAGGILEIARQRLSNETLSRMAREIHRIKTTVEGELAA